MITKQCPKCQNGINDRSDLRKCRTCYKLCCPACLLENNCIDCYVKIENKDATTKYFMEKYGVSDEI